MADSRAARQQELARLLLQKARQDLDLVVSVADSETVADEIERGAAAGISCFFIVDSVFNTSNEHIAYFCEELIRRRTGVSWGCYLRPINLPADLLNLPNDM